jgi:hypothetical protein
MSCPIVMRVIGVIVGLLFAGVAEAGTSDWVQRAINDAVSEDKPAQARIDAAARLANDWQTSLPVLVQNINGLYRSDLGTPYTKEDAATLLPLTDILASIVINNEGAIKEFRKQPDADKTVKILIWATRRPRAKDKNPNLRFSATYILASVVDNSNLCVILHHLRHDRLGNTGKANLLQVATVGTLLANEANVREAEKTVEIVEVRGFQKAHQEELEVLLNGLKRSIAEAKSEMSTRRDSEECACYNYCGRLEEMDRGSSFGCTSLEAPSCGPSP